MENTRRSTIFAIDGYEVSASFADDRNTTALHHAKQISKIHKRCCIVRMFFTPHCSCTNNCLS